jgi:hypothetical protein
LMVLFTVITTAAASPQPVVMTRHLRSGFQATLPPDQPTSVTPTPTEFANYSTFPTPKPAVGISTNELSGRGGDSGDSISNSGESSTTTHLTVITIYQTVFNNATAKDALVKFLKEKLTSAYNSFYKFFNGVIESLWKLFIPKDGYDKAAKDDTSIIALRKRIWMISAAIAGVLLPLTLLLSILTTMKRGVGSQLGFSSAREAIVHWMVTIGVGFSSYWWLDLVAKLMDSTAGAIFDGFKYDIYKDALFSSGVFSETIKNPTATTTNISFGDVAVLLYIVFMMIMLISLAIGAIIAMVSREVILFIMIFITPLAGVLINFGPLRFLKWYWLQGLTIAFLLLPINAIMFTTVVTGQELILKSSDDYHLFVGIIFCIGLVSIAVAINKAFGDAVMGSVIQVAKHAWNATQETIAAAIMVATVIATAGLSLGAAGGAEAAGLVGEAAGGAGGLSPSTPGDAKKLFDAYQKAQQTRNLTSSLGNAMSWSNSPILRGAGRGLQIGSSVSTYRDTRAEQGSELMQAWDSHWGEQFTDVSTMPGSEEAGSAITGFASMYPDDRSGALLDNLDTSQNILKVGQEEFGFGYAEILKDGFMFSKTGLLSSDGVKKGGAEFMQSYSLQKTYGTPPGRSIMGLRNTLSKPAYLARYTPETQNIHPRDLAVASTMMSKESFLNPSPQLIRDATLMVQAKRLSGENYVQILEGESSSDIKGWISNASNTLLSSSNQNIVAFGREMGNRYGK